MSRPPRKPVSLESIFVQQGAPPEPAAEAPAPSPGAMPPVVTGIPSSRPDRLVGVVQQMAESDRDRLKYLSMQERTSVQQLGMEAWNLLLEKRGLEPLKPATCNIPSGLKRGT